MRDDFRKNEKSQTKKRVKLRDFQNKNQVVLRGLKRISVLVNTVYHGII